MEAYSQRHDVAVYSTVERPEFLFYDKPFRDNCINTQILFLRLLWRHLFSNAGAELSPYAIQVILGTVSVVGTIPALHLIESWGRRRAACSIIAALVGHFTLAPTGTPKNLLTKRNKQGGDVLIAFAVLHVFTFGIFWGSTPWVYLGESFPLRVRPKSIALGSATNSVFNFLLSFFPPRIAAKIGPLILLIFFEMLMVGYVYVYLFIPETRGLALEEIDEMYRADIKPWNSADWKPHLNNEAHKKVLEGLHREQASKEEKGASLNS